MKNIKNILAVVAAMAVMPALSHAAETPTFEVGYGSFSVVGVRCTTGTVVNINATRPTGFTASIAGYRVQNQDSTNAVWLGGPTVSTTSVSAAQLAVLGEKLVAGADGAYPFNKDRSRTNTPLVPLYCRAADAAGAAGAILSVFWHGY